MNKKQPQCRRYIRLLLKYIYIWSSFTVHKFSYTDHIYITLYNERVCVRKRDVTRNKIDILLI